MDFNKLAELLFPNVTETPEDMEKRYPPRDLPEGAKVTRFAPSPTGFVHFGGLFPSTVGERLAHQSGGVFYLRIEDTDAKREVDGAAEGLITTLAHYGIHFDEGAVLDDSGKIADKGNYGPYKQSQRGSIYHVFAKSLVQKGLAYPVFTTKEELEALNAVDKKAEIKAKDWHEDNSAELKAQTEKERNITMEEVEENLAKGNPFVLRVKADGDPDRKIKFEDLVKGKMEIPENDEDFVLLKSDGIPTYHFAHAVDDHLMRTTHVIRGEEWLPSLSKHLMLFRYLDFKAPKFMHISQIMHLDENGNKKKLSKRDMGANMNDYSRMGYAPDCVCEYIMTLLNSNYEDWHRMNQGHPYTEFPFSIKKMSVSGCLFDWNKLNDVSKDVIANMPTDKVYAEVTEWAKENDTVLYGLLTRDESYAKAIFSIGRGGKKPRKDFATWADVKPYLNFFYDELFEVQEEIEPQFDRADIQKCLADFLASYDANADMNTWFEGVQKVANDNGFAGDMKAYKENPDAFKGSVADVSMFLRVAVTGRHNAPDLYTVMHLLGEERTKARIADFSRKL